MAPNYLNGDCVLISSFFKANRNDVVVCRIDKIGLVLKRIKSLNDSKMILSGDNPRQDSSICGVVLDSNLILGKVLLRLPVFRFFSYFSSKNKGLNI